MKIRSAFYVLCGLAVGVVEGRAQTAIWTGASNTLWTNSANWVSGLLPVNGSDVIFNGSGAGTSLVNTTLTLHSLTFQNTSGLILDTSGVTLSFSGGTNIVAFASNSSVALNVPISGTGTNVWLNGGTGTLLLNPGTGSNTFSGSTEVYAGGTLTDGEDNSFSPNSDLYVGGGGSHGTVLINFNEIVPDIGDVSGGNGVITIAGGKTLFINSGFTNTYTGVISGAGNLEKDGSSTQILAGANTYTGTTVIGTGATIQIGDGTNLGSLASSGISGAGGISFDVPMSLTTTYAGPISGSLGVSNNGPGTTVLSGTNLYTGATTVNQGTLKAGSSAAFSSSTQTLAVNGTGTFDINGFNTSIVGIQGAAGSTIALNGGATLILTNTILSTNIFGAITGNGSLNTSEFSLNVTGNGNTYSGGTTISSGTFIANNSSPGTYATGTGPITILSGGALLLGQNNGNGYIDPTSPIADGGALQFFRTDGSPNIIANNISGNGTVAQNSAGGMTELSGINTYSGTTTVFQGSLLAGSTSAFGGATGKSEIIFTSSGTLFLNGFNNTVGSIDGTATTGGINLGANTLTTNDTGTSTTFAASISGTGGSMVFGNNSTILTGASTYTGGTSITYGSVLVANATGLGLGTGAIAISPGATLNIGAGTTAGTISTAPIGDNGTINFNRGDQPIYSNLISGTGGISTNGGGIVLPAANTYSGVSNFNAGASVLDNATGSATGTGNIGIGAGGTLMLGLNDSGGSVGTGAIVNNSGTLIFDRSDSTAPNLIIQGSGALEMTGIGNVTLSQSDSYSGSTTIQNGQFTAGSSTAFGNGFSDLIMSSNGRLNMAGHNLDFGSITGDTSAVINTGGGTLTTGASNAITTFSGVISGSGGFLVIDGTGTTTLGGANTFNNDTTVNAGARLIIGDGVNTGATLNGNLNVGGSVVFNPAGTENMQVPYAINGTGNLTVAGSAGSVVTVTNPNGFSGSITINNGANLNIGGGVYNGNLPGSSMSGSGTVTFDNLTGGNFLNTIGGSLTVNLFGGGTYVLNATNTYTGPTTVENGTVVPGADGSFGNQSTLTVQNNGDVNVNGNNLQIGTLSGDGTALIQLGAGSLNITNNTVAAFGGVISGNGGITLSGTGTEDFYGRSTYIGTTTINSGTLADGISDAYPQFSNFQLGSGATLRVSYNETVGNLTGTGTGGAVTIASSTTLTSLGQAYSSDYMGSISGMGSFTVSGGVQGLGGTNTYSGGTLVTNGGELFVSSDTAVGSGSMTFNAGTEFSPNANVALGNDILLVGGEALDNDDGGNNNLTLSGNISETGGAGSITWCTPGTLTLYGNNSFTGGIDMREGTLVLGNTNGAGIGGTIILDTGTTLNVLSGVTSNHPLNFTGGAATLTGSGTIATPVNAGASVIIAPMSLTGGPGDLTFSSGLTLASGSAIHFDIYDATGAAGTGYGLISSTGGLNFTATANSITFNIVSTDALGNSANAINFNSSSAYSWMFATSTTAISGFAGNEFHLVQSGFQNSIGGGFFTFSQTGNDLFLNFTPVPEPSTWCLIGAGLAALAPFALRRRRLAKA